MQRGDGMNETDKPQGVSVMPPTVPIRNINVPDPTVGSETKVQDLIDAAESDSNDPDKVAKDGLA